MEFEANKVVINNVQAKTDEEKKKEEKNLETIKEAGKRLFEFGQALQGKDIYTITQAVLKFTELIPYLGPLSKIASSILGQFAPKEEDPIMKQLITMDAKLDSILYKLDDIMEHIENVAIVSSYKEQVGKVYNIDTYYNRSLENPDKITTDDLKKKCQDSVLIDFITWIHREMTIETLQSLKSYISKEYDMEKLLSWSKLIVGNVGQAIYLHSICMGLRQQDNKDNFAAFDKALEIDNANFETKLEDIRTQIFDLEKFIKKNFWKNMAMDEIKNLADKHGYTERNNAFVPKVYEFLNNKYPFRSWLVHCINDNAINGKYVVWLDQNSNVPRSQDKPIMHNYWRLGNGKQLFVASSDSRKRNFTIITPDDVWRSSFPTIDGPNGLSPCILWRIHLYHKKKTLENWIRDVHTCLRYHDIYPDVIGASIRDWNWSNSYYSIKGTYPDITEKEYSDGVWRVDGSVRYLVGFGENTAAMDVDVFIVDKDLD